MPARLLAALGAVLLLGSAGRRARCCPSSAAAPPALVSATAADERLVFMDLALLEVPEETVVAVVGGTSATDGGPRVLSVPAAEALWRRVVAQPGVTQLDAPKILGTVEQDSSIWVGESGTDGSRTGLDARITPHLLPGSDPLSLHVRVAQTQAGRPAAAAEREVTAVGASLRSQETLLLVGSRAADGGARFVVVLAAVLLDPKPGPEASREPTAPPSGA